MNKFNRSINEQLRNGTLERNMKIVAQMGLGASPSVLAEHHNLSVARISQIYHNYLKMREEENNTDHPE